MPSMTGACDGPMPSVNPGRPIVHAAADAARFACSTGWAVYVWRTAVPSSIVDVSRPTAAIGVTGSPATALGYHERAEAVGLGLLGLLDHPLDGPAAAVQADAHRRNVPAAPGPLDRRHRALRHPGARPVRSSTPDAHERDDSRPNLVACCVVSPAVIAIVADVPPGALTGAGDIEPLFRAHYAAARAAPSPLACGDGELAADAVQEAFVRAHRRWRSIGAYEDPIGWVRHVALNLLRDDQRRAARKRRALARVAATATSTAPPAEPDDVAALLESLPRQQRIAAALFYVDELSIAEVAAAMGLAEGTVKSHLHDARRTLRAVVGEER